MEEQKNVFVERIMCDNCKLELKLVSIKIVDNEEIKKYFCDSCKSSHDSKKTYPNFL